MLRRGTIRHGLALALVLGCGTKKDEEPPSNPPAYLTDLNSCVRAENAPKSAPFEYEHAFEGTLVAIDTTSLPDCFYSTSGFTLELETNASERWTIGVSTLGAEHALAIGDVISVEAMRKGAGFSRPEGATRLTLRRAGELVLYVDDSGPGALDLPPELTELAYGDGCVVNDDCGSWAARPLEVAVNGERTSVPYGATVALAGYELRGGFTEQLSSKGCPDYSVEYLALAASLTATPPP
jgi:hypothetical protein